MTFRDEPGAVDSPAIATNLLDQRCGIVAGLEEIPVRSPWHMYQASISEPLWRLRPEGGRVAAGCNVDRRQAEASAIGEAVERYSSMHADRDRLRRASYRQLVSQQERALNPTDLQLSRAPSDAVLTADTECDWVRGTDTSGSCWVPAALAWTEPGRHARTAKGKPYCAPHSQGIALADTWERARQHALGEAIERHALATAWHLGLVFDELNDDQGIHRWLVPNRWSLPVVLAAIVEPGWISAGCAFADHQDAAAAKASAEAVMMSHTLELAASDENPWAGQPEPVDPGDAFDLPAHAAICRRPEIFRRQLDRLGFSAPPPPHGTPPTPRPGLSPAPGRQDRQAATDPADALRSDGIEAVTIDLTTPEVASAGWTVVRVVAPGLRVAAPSAYLPPTGGIDPLPATHDLTPIPVI